MDKIPTSKLSRGKVVGKAILKIGAKKTKHIISKRPQQSKDEEIASVIFEALGELKGISVKVAQQIALGMPFLPQAYIDKMSESFDAIPPINKALVRKIIKTELKAYPSEVFESFSMDAFASASLGQVHLASYDEQKVCVKVQYPGMRESIKTDMSLISFGLRKFAKGEDVGHIVGEIEQRLYEEVDYELEAKNYEFFKKHLQNPFIVIPQVYPNLSTSKVLSVEFLDGVSLKEYLASNPSQEERNHYAQVIFDSFFDALYHLKAVHADPNPGNFIFLPDRKLGMIDFGCIKHINKEFLDSYNELHLDLLDGVDNDKLVVHYDKLGMIPKGSKDEMLEFYQEVIKPLDRLYIEPLKATEYKFGKDNSFAKRGFEMIFEVQKKQYHSVHNINEEYIFLDRTLLGYYAIFEKMEATICTSYVQKLMRSKRCER